MFIRSVDLLVAAVRLGVPGRNATWGNWIRMRLVLRTRQVHLQRTSLAKKLRCRLRFLGTSSGRFFVLTPRDLI
jgi:hypothetical protein